MKIVLHTIQKYSYWHHALCRSPHLQIHIL